VTEWSPIQGKILEALSDGMPHAPEELLALIDSEASIGNLQNHLSLMRRKLRPLGHDILAVYHDRTLHYRHVRLLATEDANL
jgi:hypothetical protein